MRQAGGGRRGADTYGRVEVQASVSEQMQLRVSLGGRTESKCEKEFVAGWRVQVG